MRFCRYSLWSTAGIHRQKIRRFNMAVALFLVYQTCIPNGVFAQEDPKKISKIEKTEVVRNKNTVLSTNRGHAEPKIYLGKIYMMPPELSQKSEQERIEQAQNDLLDLYRERHLIQKTLKRLEERASRRQRRVKKKTRRPCI